MAERVVISRRGRVISPAVKEFTFNAAQIPAPGGNGSGPEFVREYRQRAWEAYQRLPLPAPTEEAWRRTDLRGLDAGAFSIAKSVSTVLPPPAELLQPLVGETSGGQILMTPGEAQVYLDPDLAARGVIFTDLLTAERQHPEVLAHILGQVVRSDESKFAALAAALARHGALVYVPRGLQLEQPLHSVFWAPGSGLAFFSHLLVWLDEGASLTFVHESASPNESAGPSLHAGIVEVHVAAEANLRFVDLQSWGEHVWNFTHERVRVGRNANLDWIFAAVGSRLTKNFSDLDLLGEGAVGRMSGFYFTHGVQHLDHDTQQNHMAPHTTSDLLFKGALTGKSRSVWQGMIYVAPGAQKTDGYQANRNLTLSKEARADSIPGLEILADDVRCTHGATVGKIDPDEIFYLLSRGIPRAEAERLIVEGFFDPIMQRIPFEGVRTRLEQAIEAKMGS
jgi:Fe-S cluster assembly protein SufD